MSVITMTEDRKFSTDGINVIEVEEGQVISNATPDMLAILKGSYEEGEKKVAETPAPTPGDDTPPPPAV